MGSRTHAGRGSAMDDVLVTGATGFIGSRLVDALVADKRHVRAIVRRPAQVAEVERDGDRDGVTAFLGDVTDRASLDAAFEGGGGGGAGTAGGTGGGAATTAGGGATAGSGPPGAVVHLAAVIRPPSRYEAVNVQGTRNVVDAAASHGVDRFVHVSVLRADAKADHPYLRSRGLAEHAVQGSGLDWTVVRPSLVYGPGDHVVSLVAQICQGPVTPVPGDGRVRMAPVHVEDLVPCVKAALGPDHVGDVLELAGPDVVTYKELVQHIVNRVNPRSRIRHVPRPLAKVGAWVMARRGYETSPTEVGLLSTGDNVPADNDAPDLLGEAPRGLDEGLKYLGPTGAYGEPGPLT